jgi:hypothetical protein
MANDVSCACFLLVSSVNFFATISTQLTKENVGQGSSGPYIPWRSLPHNPKSQFPCCMTFFLEVPANVTLTIASFSDQSLRSGNGLSSTRTSFGPWKTTPRKVFDILRSHGFAKFVWALRRKCGTTTYGVTVPTHGLAAESGLGPTATRI